MSSLDLNKSVDAKLAALDTVGAIVEMSADEAELAGAFAENAISLEEAVEAAYDSERGVQ